MKDRNARQQAAPAGKPESKAAQTGFCSLTVPGLTTSGGTGLGSVLGGLTLTLILQDLFPKDLGVRGHPWASWPCSGGLLLA